MAYLRGMERVVDGLRGAFQVSRAGQVVAGAAGGLADDDTGEPCTLATRFQAGSISKLFVAAAMMLLSEGGALSLDDRVARWWPLAPPAWRDMTVAHVLAHRAGLVHWDGLPGFDLDQPRTRREILEQASQLPLLFDPGSGWAYSCVGYLLAAAIIEGVAGQPYAEFVAEHIFRPLRMDATTSGLVPDGHPWHSAQGHRDGRPIPLVSWLTSLPGTGDVWSTVEDLVRYADAVSAGDLLTERSLRLMTHPHAVVAPSFDAGLVTAAAYGYGVYIGSINGCPARFHTGDNPGFRSLLAWLPEAHVSLAILSNDDSRPLDAVISQLEVLTDG